MTRSSLRRRNKYVKKHSFVSGEDLFEGGNSLTLYGVVECLKAGITEQQANTGDIFLNDGDFGGGAGAGVWRRGRRQHGPLGS